MVVCYINSLETLGNESRLRFTAELDYAAGQVLETPSKAVYSPRQRAFFVPESFFKGWDAPCGNAGGMALDMFRTSHPPRRKGGSFNLPKEMNHA